LGGWGRAARWQEVQDAAWRREEERGERDEEEEEEEEGDDDDATTPPGAPSDEEYAALRAHLQRFLQSSDRYRPVATARKSCES
jgi:hypothetical protein